MATITTKRVGNSRTDLNDMGYFDTYPSKMYEAMTALSPAEKINSTTPHYGPLLYTIGRSMGAHNVLEIGIASGWTGGFMAWAVQENNTRYQMNGKYYGLDIAEKPVFASCMDELKLPYELIAHPLGSVDYLEKHADRWPAEFFNMIYIDGYHNTEYIMRETELLWPKLMCGGNGYLIYHDAYSYGEEADKLLSEGMLKDCERIRFLQNYGIAIYRKMEGYDHSKIFWPEGDQNFTEFAT